jgi:hypothetical protein
MHQGLFVNAGVRVRINLSSVVTILVFCYVFRAPVAGAVDGTEILIPSPSVYEEKYRSYRTAVSDAAWERCAQVRERMIYCDTDRVCVYDYVAERIGPLFAGLRPVEVHILVFLTIFEAALSEQRQGEGLIEEYERARRMLGAAEERLSLRLSGDGDYDHVIEINEARGAVQRQCEIVDSLQGRVAWLSRRQAVLVSALEETLKKIEALDKKTVATADYSGEK